MAKQVQKEHKTRKQDKAVSAQKAAGPVYRYKNGIANIEVRIDAKAKPAKIMWKSDRPIETQLGMTTSGGESTVEEVVTMLMNMCYRCYLGANYAGIDAALHMLHCIHDHAPDGTLYVDLDKIDSAYAAFTSYRKPGQAIPYIRWHKI